MAIQERLYTAEEFWTVIPSLDDNKRYELIKGEIIEMAPSSPTNSMIAVRVSAMLFQYVDEKDLGYVLGADGGYILSPGDVRVPDVSFIAKARLPELPKHIQGAPDLAVEIVSPSETSRMVMSKVSLYLQAGTTLVWVVYPEDEVVDVYRPATDGMHVQRIDKVGTLSGEAVLPDFTLPVSKIFP